VYLGDAPKLATYALTRGREETYRFSQAVLEASASGTPPHCFDAGDLWVSESVEDRRRAEQLCHGCPVLKYCHTAAAARKERFGVWGGIDRSPHGKKGATIQRCLAARRNIVAVASSV
jgi:hypothetical protein